MQVPTARLSNARVKQDELTAHVGQMTRTLLTFSRFTYSHA